MSVGKFQETDGSGSMRRFLAFLFCLASICAGLLSIVKDSSWQVVAASFGVPGIISAAFMFFTTWEDVKKIISAWKKNE